MVQIIKRGESWQLTVYSGRDGTGKKLREFMTIPANEYTKQEAKHIGMAFETEVKQKSKKINDSMTFTDFVEYWKENYSNHKNRATTRQRHEQLFLRILPHFGRFKLKEIKPSHILDFYKKISEGERLDGRKGKLSGRSLQLHHRLLAVIFSKAVKWQILKQNPCVFVDMPEHTPKKVPFYDDELLGKFIQLLYEKAPLRYRLWCLLAFSTGLRRGEVFGLRWEDIDYANGFLNVVQSAVVISGKGFVYGEPKTKESKSSQPISDEVIELLKEHQADTGMKKGLVFSKPDGTKMHYTQIARWLNTFTEDNGLPHISPHSFRHMSISYAMETGADLKKASAHGRHSDENTTLKYLHIVKPKSKIIARRLNKIISKNKEK